MTATLGSTGVFKLVQHKMLQSEEHTFQYVKLVNPFLSSSDDAFLIERHHSHTMQHDINLAMHLLLRTCAMHSPNGSW